MEVKRIMVNNYRFLQAEVIDWIGGLKTVNHYFLKNIDVYKRQIMPVIQAHYGVGYVPIGFELSTWFNTTRNVFDRFTHFFYGFLLFYPLYEMIKYEIGNRKFMNYMIPAALLLGMASVYEILEWLVFEFSGPRLSFLFIGAQDDFYDTPKDMAMTFIRCV